MNWTWAGIITAACILIAAVIGYNRGFIKEAVSTLLLFLSILMVWFINPYVNQFLRENTPLYTTLSEGSAKAVSGVIESGVKVSREEQGKLIDSLPLPKMLKEDMKEKNTAGTYRDLEVKNFSDYIAKYLAELLLNGISFLASFLLATIILRVIAFALESACHTGSKQTGRCGAWSDRRGGPCVADHGGPYRTVQHSSRQNGFGDDTERYIPRLYVRTKSISEIFH